MMKNRIQGNRGPRHSFPAHHFFPNAVCLAPGDCLAGFQKAPTSRRDRNFAFVPRPDRGGLLAHPACLLPEIMARQPLSGPSRGAHKTLIYNI
jgi:hypothetical protein